MPKATILKVSSLVSAVLLFLSLATAAFVAGYALAFSRVSAVYADVSVLKAKAVELEAEMLHLRNYAVLIDAIASEGQASQALFDLAETRLAQDTFAESKVGEASSAPAGILRADGASPK